MHLYDYVYKYYPFFKYILSIIFIYWFWSNLLMNLNRHYAKEAHLRCNPIDLFQCRSLLHSHNKRISLNSINTLRTKRSKKAKREKC